MASVTVTSTRRCTRFWYRNTTAPTFDEGTSRAQRFSAVPTSPSRFQNTTSLQSNFPSNATIVPIFPDQQTDRAPTQSFISYASSVPAAVTATETTRRPRVTFTTTITLPPPLPTDTSISNGDLKPDPTSAAPAPSETDSSTYLTISIISKTPMSRPSDRRSLDWSVVAPTTTISSSQQATNPTVPENTALPDEAEPNAGEPSSQSQRVSAPAVAGGVLGGFVGLALLGALLFVCCRRRHPRRSFGAWKRRIKEKWRPDDESILSGEPKSLVRRFREFAHGRLSAAGALAAKFRRRQSHQSPVLSTHSGHFFLPEVVEVSRTFNNPFRDSYLSEDPEPARLRCMNPDPSAPTTPSAGPTPAGSIASARPSFARKISGLPIFAAMTGRGARTPPQTAFGDRSGRPSTSGTGNLSPTPRAQQNMGASPAGSSLHLSPTPRFLAPPPAFQTRPPSSASAHGTTPGLPDKPNPLDKPISLDNESNLPSSAAAPKPPAQPTSIYLVPPSSSAAPSLLSTAASPPPPSARTRSVSPAATYHSRASSLPISRQTSAASGTQQQPARARISDPFVLDCPEVLGYGGAAGAGAAGAVGGSRSAHLAREEGVAPMDWAVNF